MTYPYEEDSINFRVFFQRIEMSKVCLFSGRTELLHTLHKKKACEHNIVLGKEKVKEMKEKRMAKQRER